MKQLCKMVLLVVVLSMPVLYACSQVPPPPGSGDAPLQQLTPLQGKVDGFVSNDRYEYDGFTLHNGGQTLRVSFAPHLAARLMSIVKAGGAVNLQGFYETTPEGVNAFHLVTATAGGQTIADVPGAEPPTPPVDSVVSFNGTVIGFKKDPMGLTNGILLSGNRAVELPPGAYDELQAVLVNGATVSGTGLKTVPPAGVVLAQNVEMIRPQTLTCKGQTYMIR